MLGSAPLRLDAIRAVAAFDNERLGRLLIDQYPGFSAAERAEALQTMASRPRYGRMLTEAIARASSLAPIFPRRSPASSFASSARRSSMSGARSSAAPPTNGPTPAIARSSTTTRWRGQIRQRAAPCSGRRVGRAIG